MRFRKRPIVIEAFQITVKRRSNNTDWPDDWIIKGVQGELYPCKPDIFLATHEAV